MNKLSQELSIADFHKWWWFAVVWVFGFLVVGLLYWKDLALSVVPPGFQALLSFLSLPIGILLCVGLVRIRIKYRNKSFVNVLSSWIIALIIATINLVLYSLPIIEAWMFVGLMVVPSAFLLIGRPKPSKTKHI